MLPRCSRDAPEMTIIQEINQFDKKKKLNGPEPDSESAQADDIVRERGKEMAGIDTDGPLTSETRRPEAVGRACAYKRISQPNLVISPTRSNWAQLIGSAADDLHPFPSASPVAPAALRHPQQTPGLGWPGAVTSQRHSSARGPLETAGLARWHCSSRPAQRNKWKESRRKWHAREGGGGEMNY